MTTTERSMKLMENGLDGSKREEDDVICPVVAALARRAAENFRDLDREMDDPAQMEDILGDIRELADIGDADGAVEFLKHVFWNEEYDGAAEELELLDACDYSGAKKEFMDLFLEEDDVDDIEIRILFRGGVPETVKIRKNPPLLS